jgi:hypothetical protein
VPCGLGYVCLLGSPALSTTPGSLSKVGGLGTAGATACCRVNAGMLGIEGRGASGPEGGGGGGGGWQVFIRWRWLCLQVSRWRGKGCGPQTVLSK